MNYLQYLSNCMNSNLSKLDSGNDDLLVHLFVSQNGLLDTINGF